jgi:hypothetical protein
MKLKIEQIPFKGQFRKACLWAMVVIACISAWRALISYDDANSIYLSVSLKSPQAGIAALYYDVGKGYNDNHVASASIRGDNQVYDYLYKLPNKTLYNLRWDPPPATDDPISIRKMEILDGSRKLVKRLNLRQLEPMNQIQTLELSDDQADIRVQEGANDPQVNIRLESPVIVKRLNVLIKFLSGVLLEFTGLFFGVCLLTYIWFRQRNKVVATVIVVFLVIFGWRCWTLYDDAVSLFLQVPMQSSIAGTAQIYYDLGLGMNEGHSMQTRTTAGEGLQPYRFKLPNKMIYELRLDPLTTDGKVLIGEIKLTDAFGKVIREIDLSRVEPRNQIESIHPAHNGLDVSVSKDANDPQLTIDLDGSLNFEGKLPFPLKEFLLKLMLEAVFYLLLASVFLLVWRKWGNLCLEGLDSPFVQEKMPLIYLGTALGLMLAMGFVSGLDVNPDEWNGHIKAAAYYIQNWLPPAVDDPRVVSSISVFGVSYLWHIDPFYLFAVKTTQVLSGIVSDFHLRVRLFNALLFLALVLVVATQIKRSQWMVPFLVISPQVWYVFSYFNNDAFPLFIAVILAMQFVDPESSLGRFLSAPAIRKNRGHAIWVGVLIGLLISSKLNYRLYIVFLIFVALWRVLFETDGLPRILQLKRWLFLFAVALLVYLPIYGYDQYVNDFKKDEKVVSVMERYAASQFKLSTIQNDLSSSYKGLRLRDKGVSFQELFLQNSDWRDMSFKSFFGVYGYMDLVSDKDYYRAVTYALGVFFLLVFFYVAFTLSGRNVIFFLCVLLFAGLAVGQSVYHSWINDYQPQGRYLFVILPMFLVGLARLPVSFRTRIMPLFGLIFFVLSVWSFLLTGLNMIPKIN